MEKTTHEDGSISIPKPCHFHWEDLDEINAAKRSCSSCNRIIHDFSKMSDAELIHFLQKNKHACGRFGSDQLDRAMPVAETSTGLRKMALLLRRSPLGPAMLLSLAAQAKTKEVKTAPVIVAQNILPGKNNSQPDTIPAGNTTIVIEGRITDTLGNPVAYAYVQVQGKKDTACLTDSTGCFHITTIDVQSARILVTISAIGYRTVTELLPAVDLKADASGQPSKKLDYVLAPVMETYMMGEIVSTTTITKPQSKIGRFFHGLLHPRNR